MIDIEIVPGKQFKINEANHLSKKRDRLPLWLGGTRTHSGHQKKPSDC